MLDSLTSFQITLQILNFIKLLLLLLDTCTALKTILQHFNNYGLFITIHLASIINSFVSHHLSLFCSSFKLSTARTLCLL